MMRYWRSAAAVLASVCLLAAGCAKKWTWEDAMQALRDDPMASASWEGLELLGTSQTVNEGHKPEPPIFTRCYKLSVPVNQAFDVVIASALEQGWEEKKRRTAKDAILKKLISGYNAGVILTTHTGGCKEFPETVFRITMLYP